MQKVEDEIELPQNIIKLLCDKSNDKRKVGVKDLEYFLKEKVKFNSNDSLNSAIKAFKSLSDAVQPQYIRRAAYLCFTTLANILKQHENSSDMNDKDISSIIYLTIQNIIQSFKDNDAKIVYSAAESLYNIMKYFPNLVIHFFNDIFEGLLLISVNPDSEVRSLAQNLDSLLKEIVNFTLQDNQLPLDFNLREFFQKIYEKITAKHPSVRVMIVSWIVFINSIPEIKIINVLQDFLAALFNMLSEKQKEVNQSAEKCLKDLLKEIDNFFDSLSYDVEVKILEILIEQCKSTQDRVLQTAFEWINLFLSKYKFYLIQNKKSKSPYTKSIAATNKTSVYYRQTGGVFLSGASGLSNMTIEHPFETRSDENNLTHTASVCEGERKIPYNLFPKILDIIISSTNHQNVDIKRISSESNNELITIIEFYSELQIHNQNQNQNLPIQQNNTKIKLFEEVLKKYFNTEEKESTLELVLIWINKLFKKFHEETFTKIEDFIESISCVLCHNNDNLFTRVLEIICEIAKYKEENIEIVVTIILEKLCANKNLLNNKGLAILKKFSTILHVDRVYSTFADVLMKMKESEFVERMINILNLYLITGKETEPLRNLLKNIKKNNQLHEKQFFEKLFRTWSINPVSSLILCLLAEYYELSNFLLIKFGDLDLNAENYVELAQLVQLLESSVFMHIRINLLEPKRNIYLVKSLFGILLMLPQGKAYQALYKRLKHIEVIYKLDTIGKIKNSPVPEYSSDEIDNYMSIFESVHNSGSCNSSNLEE